MKKPFKWFAIILIGIIVALLLVAGTVYVSTESKINKTYDYPVNAIPIPTDSASLTNGM